MEAPPRDRAARGRLGHDVGGDDKLAGDDGDGDDDWARFSRALLPAGGDVDGHFCGVALNDRPYVHGAAAAVFRFVFLVVVPAVLVVACCVYGTVRVRSGGHAEQPDDNGDNGSNGSAHLVYRVVGGTNLVLLVLLVCIFVGAATVVAARMLKVLATARNVRRLLTWTALVVPLAAAAVAPAAFAVHRVWGCLIAVAVAFYVFAALWRLRDVAATARLVSCAADVLRQLPAVLRRTVLLLVRAVGLVAVLTGGIIMLSSGGEYNEDGKFIYWRGIVPAMVMLSFAAAWLAWFLLSAWRFVLSGVAACWYFHRENAAVFPADPVQHFAQLAKRQSLGLLSLVSLVMAAVGIVRDVCRVVERAVAARHGRRTRNPVVMALRFASWLLSCLTVAVDIVSELTLAYHAVYGESLGRSNARACGMLKRQGVRCVRIDALAESMATVLAMGFALVFGGIAYGVARLVLGHGDPSYTASAGVAIVVTCCTLVIVGVVMQTVMGILNGLLVCVVIDTDRERLACEANEGVFMLLSDALAKSSEQGDQGYHGGEWGHDDQDGVHFHHGHGHDSMLEPQEGYDEESAVRIGLPEGHSYLSLDEGGKYGMR